MNNRGYCALILILLVAINLQYGINNAYIDEGNKTYFRTAENNAEPTIDSLNSTHVEDDNFQLPNNFTALDFTITNTSEYIFAGYFSGTVQLNSTNSISSNASSEDMLVLQTDFNGTILNKFHAGGSDADRIRGMDIDPYGNLYFGGYMGGDMVLNGTQYLTADREGVVFKLDPSFNVVWSNNVTTNGNGNQIADVKWNSTNSIAIVGDCNKTKNGISFNNSGSNIVTYKNCDIRYTSSHTRISSDAAPVGVNVYVAKLNSTGDWQWAKKTEGAGSLTSSIMLNVFAQKVWYDSSGRIVIQGNTTSPYASYVTVPGSWSNSGVGIKFGDYKISHLKSNGVFLGRLSESGDIGLSMATHLPYTASDPGANIRWWFNGTEQMEDGRVSMYNYGARKTVQGLRATTPTSACWQSQPVYAHISWLNETLCTADGYSVFAGSGTIGYASITSAHSTLSHLIVTFQGTGTIRLGSNDVILTSSNTPVVAHINTSKSLSSQYSTEYGWGWAVPLDNYVGYSIDGTIVSEPGDVHVLLSSGRQTLLRITEDSDGDKIGKYSDKFPSDSTQWDDYDGDGFGDQSTGNNPDGCVTQVGNSIWPVLGCPDYDSDGWSDTRDRFPGYSSQWNDTDWDGYGDNQSGFRPDSCLSVTGTSNRNATGAINGEGAVYGCPDSDYDGFGNNIDDCPNIYGDSIKAIANALNITKMGCGDADKDGYEDTTDPCQLQYGTSWIDRFACPDLDNDGISDFNDPRPSNPTNDSQDWDSDGIMDYRNWTFDNKIFWINGTDVFPNNKEEWTDSDGDGYGDNDADKFPLDPNEHSDSDNDGIGDNTDDCPSVNGTSSEGNYLGCHDSDQDGWADLEDRFPYQITQWNDSDSDGYGDNPTGDDPDACLNQAGTSTIDRLGCLDSDNDGTSDQNDDCILQPGTSTIDRSACPDVDGDNVSDFNDPYPSESTATATDWDGDGIDDFNLQFNLNGSDVFPQYKTQTTDGDSDSWGDNNSTGAEKPDLFPNDSSQWSDSDGDGFGDNESGTNGDECKTEWGNSTEDRLGCIDTDGDGWSDPYKSWRAHPDGDADSHPEDPTQWQDSDGDGYGDKSLGNLPDECPGVRGFSTMRVVGMSNESYFGCMDSDSDGYEDMSDPCRFEPGYSWADRLGCPDADGDGISDSNDPAPNSPASSMTDWDGDGVTDFNPLYSLNGSDIFPHNPTQWQDSDLDGWGDNNSPNATQIDRFPFDETQWVDSDGDGFGDQNGPLATTPDACPLQFGNSTEGGVNGCTDRDGDGWADSIDVFLNDPTEWKDGDGDGFGDNKDECKTISGDSSLLRIGCPDTDRDGLPEPEDKCPTLPGAASDGCPDSDLDGVSDTLDNFPYDATQWQDSDEDGLGDNTSGNNPDPYPNDSDNDGILNPLDFFPTNPSQWNDSDGDGYGDNWADWKLNSSRKDGWPGMFLPNATQTDAFPTDSEQWSDADADGWGDVPGSKASDDCPSQPGNSTRTMSGCPDMDGDGIPDILDPDADGDGIYNTWEYQLDTDPFNAEEAPSDNDGDGEPDSADDDDDNDGFPDEIEMQRGSDPFDAGSNPLEEYGGGTYYIPGEGFSSQYNADGIEISFGAIVDLASSEFLAPLLLAPLTIYLLLAKRRRFKRMQNELEEAPDNDGLEALEEEIDHLIGRNKLKIGHALLLRNQLERQQGVMRSPEHAVESKMLPSIQAPPPMDQKSPLDTESRYGVDDGPPMSARGTIGKDGYEYLKWPEGSSTQWFRAIGTGEGWKKWE
jgi:hypothetical protein